MTDNFIRHMVAFIAASICLMAYVSGYFSGQYGWWWTAGGILIVYGGVYRIIDK